MKNKTKYDVIYYKNENNRSPVREWIKDFDNDDQRKIKSKIYRMATEWENLSQSGFIKKLKGAKNLSEIKFQGNKKQIRIIFMILGQEAVLLHGFIKKRSSYKAEIQTAESRARNYEEQSNEK